MLIFLKKLNGLRRHFGGQIGPVLSWLVSSREPMNFTYQNTPATRAAIVHAVAVLFDRPAAEVTRWADAIESDAELRQRIRVAIARQPAQAIERDPGYGRNLLTALAVRATRPRMVFEAGTAHGLGTVLIAHALAANTREGSPGRVLTVDLDPRAGWLLESFTDLPIAQTTSDSLSALKPVAAEVDFLLYDTINDARLERAHYDTVHQARRGAPYTLMANWHASGVLAEFSGVHARRYCAVATIPQQHWYPGNVLGVSAGTNAAGATASARTTAVRPQDEPVRY